MNDTTESSKQIYEKYLINPPITDGSKKVDDGILEIIGHYTHAELLEDHTKAVKDLNKRKTKILEFVIARIYQDPKYIDRIMVSTMNNSAGYSVSFNGYTLDKNIVDINKAMENGKAKLKLGRLNLETLEVS